MRYKTVIGHFLCAALLLIAVSGCRDATGYVKRGIEREKKGDFDGAKADFSKAIELKPDFVAAYIDRGDVKYKTDDLNGAQADYSKAAKLEPDLIHPHYLSQFAQVNPTNPIADQAVILLEAKQYDKLDALAATLRTSKQCYADGVWELSSLYNGLVPLNSVPDAAWDDRLSDIGLWAVARPDSITARVAWGNVLVAYAWKARGGGEVNTVTPEGWKLFFQRLVQGASILKAAKSLNEQCPEYWSVLMRAALGLQADRVQFDGIFDEAIKFKPDYEAYYFRRAIYLLPRWDGREGEWESDLTKSADKLGGEDGDMLYAQIVWNLSKGYFINPFQGGNLSWQRVDKGFGIIQQRFPDSLEARMERAYLAALEQYTSAMAYYNRGYADYREGDLNGALTNFDKTIELLPTFYGAYYCRSLVKTARGDFVGAQTDYDKSIELKPRPGSNFPQNH
jgi:tetratricopeptide (TPR) repeat protein